MFNLNIPNPPHSIATIIPPVQSTTRTPRQYVIAVPDEVDTRSIRARGIRLELGSCSLRQFFFAFQSHPNSGQKGTYRNLENSSHASGVVSASFSDEDTRSNRVRGNEFV
jgi:hypothetical protein